MLKITTKGGPEQLEGPWISYEAASKHTDLSEAWLRILVNEGKVPFRRVGRRVLFSVPALDRWISNGGAMQTSEGAVA